MSFPPSHRSIAGAPSPYRGEGVALATKHGKERAVARPLRAGLGLLVRVPPELDTDCLGTFTGEVARQGTPREVVEKKARLGMANAGSRLGLATEGSFGPHPALPFVPSHHEYVAFVDAERDIVVVESHLGTETNFDQATCETWEEAAAFAERVRFPSHGLIVRPEGDPDPAAIVKGLHAAEDYREAVRAALDRSSTGRASIEPDMRAHCNPTRMRAIRGLAVKLARRLRRHCPSCDCPGFGLVDTEAGLPCEDCASPTRLVHREIHGCARCPERISEWRRDGARLAPARHCDYCNP